MSRGLLCDRLILAAAPKGFADASCEMLGEHACGKSGTQRYRPMLSVKVPGEHAPPCFPAIHNPPVLAITELGGRYRRRGHATLMVLSMATRMER